MVANDSYRKTFILEVLQSGFIRAATSFSQLTGKKISIKATAARTLDSTSLIIAESEELYNVLITDIIGDLHGQSLLIFDNQEAEKFVKLIQPLNTHRDMKEALLMEMGNIISASVISELSNKMNITDIYGDVPHFKHLSVTELYTVLRGSTLPTETVSKLFLIQTSFAFEDATHINPQFVWKLEEDFLKAVPFEPLNTSVKS